MSSSVIQVVAFDYIFNRKKLLCDPQEYRQNYRVGIVEIFQVYLSILDLKRIRSAVAGQIITYRLAYSLEKLNLRLKCRP